MVNTGTVAAGGVQPREIRDVPGSEIMGISIIGLRGLRSLMMDVASLRVSAPYMAGYNYREK